ncbi:MAG TPA: ABC transporter substrate-binding protein [Acidobacteriota bacterium]|nr:ABC transporter substrate-binding protein [Acidobacteriota bacterium]
MDKIRIGIGVPSIGRFLPFVGAAAGLFDRHHITIEVINQNDEEKIVEDIVSQATPIGTPNAPSLLFSRLRGNDLVVIGGILNRPAFYLAANGKISSIEDLKEKRVGINQPRRMAGMMMLALLRRWALDSTRDLELVDLGVNDRSVDALRAGEIDAALLPPEKAFLMETEGFRLIADSLDLDCQWVPLATTRRFLAQHRTLVTNVTSVYRDSIQLFKNDSQMVIDVIRRQLPALNNRSQVIEKCCRAFAPLFEPNLTLSLASLRSILAEVALQDPRAKELDPSGFIEKVV